MKPEITLPHATLETAFATISALAEDFAAHEVKYLSPAYQEAEVRKDFLDKFFIALGWDVNHEREKNPYEQEVKVELGQQQGAARKRADYAFHLAPDFKQPRFFVEAKKPSRSLENADAHFQTIRYGFSAQTPLAVLTDFEEFRILDSRYKAAPETALGRVVAGGKFHYRDYLDKEKFARIYWLFSREAVAGGSLEKFAEGLPKPRGGAKQLALFPGGDKSFDEAFLEELDEHRLALAKSFKKSDDALDSGTLTEITQRTIDRLVFIRFLEDRLIEPNDIISQLGARGSAWGDFRAQCRRLDGIYNGIVFKKHPLLDSPDFSPDDDVFADICEALSHKNSAYDFSTVPIHILGSIYERFLGNVIRATPKRAEIEQKPDVRKAGGVYYTPDYIVRYLVEGTVGHLIEGRKPEAIAQMRFADIACGSGSFLLGIYECLLAYHTAYYNKFPKQATQADCLTREGSLHLSLKKRRDILLNNIFGVDIDAQAVEVAQLSLYLRLLQDETASSAHQYRMDFEQGAILPSLSANIKCGNSLIGTDVLHGQFEFGTKEEQKLNPMNFEAAFPSLFPRFVPAGKVAETPELDDFIEGGLIHSAGPANAKYSAKVTRCPRPRGNGFDAIVGNPPYVRPHNIEPQVKEYLWAHYDTFTHKADLYCCFLEQATRLLKNNGRFGYIISKGWLRLNSFQKLRRLILANYRIEEIAEFDHRVFADAQVETSLFVFEKERAPAKNKAVISVRSGKPGEQFQLIRKIPQQVFETTFENVFDLSLFPEAESIKEKMRQGPTIDRQFDVCFGLKTGDDAKFLHRQEGLHSQDKPLLRGDDVFRYGYAHKGEFVWYVPEKMREHRQTARPGESARFEQPKVLVKDTSKLFAGTYDDSHYYVKDVLIIIPHADNPSPYDLRFVTGIVNSRALSFYYRSTFQTLHVQRGELASLPLPPLDFTNFECNAAHDKIVRLVDAMLEAQKMLAAAKTEKECDYYKGKCVSLDSDINTLVYRLYGLTPEEIALIEAATRTDSVQQP